MNDYQENLKSKMDEYVHLVYRITKNFPKAETYGVISQIRRASLSVVLNFIEGYARQKRLVEINFWEISYGSLQESKYLLQFSMVEGYIEKTDFEKALKLSEEIGAMLWKQLAIKKNCNE